jgi:hypothetical protein
MPVAPNVVPTLLLIIVGWRMVIRFRRNVGRQPLNPKRMIFRICIYALITSLLAAAAMVPELRLPVLAGLAGGLVGGAALGFYGLHLTRCETTTEGRFYTPNPYMGVGLSVLLLGRLIYRCVEISNATQSGAVPHFEQSPLTLFFYGLLAGYYMTYFAGVLQRHRVV